MGWNRPGDNDKNQDPWNSKKNNQSPPDLDKLIADFFAKIRNLLHLKPSPNRNTPSGPSSPMHGMGVGVIVGIIILLWFLSGLFIVNPAEQSVILRFGKFLEVQNSGLHWMARFIETRYTVNVQKINSFALQGDFLTKSAEQGDLPNQVIPVSKTTPEIDGLASDKSKNLVDVEMTVQYRVNDPQAYLFNVVDPDKTIQEVSAGALSEVIGKMKLDDVLTTGRELLSSNVLQRIKEVLYTYKPGLEVAAVTLRRVQAPEQVQVAFNDVNRAYQDKATYIQQAQAYASKVVPLAQGNAARILADAKAYQQQVILSAQAQIAKFQALLNVYKTAPELTKQRMYIETMQQIFQNTSKVLIDTNSANNVLYLPIDKFLQIPKTNETTSTESSAQTTNYLASQMNDNNAAANSEQTTEGANT